MQKNNTKYMLQLELVTISELKQYDFNHRVDFDALLNQILFFYQKLMNQNDQFVIEFKKIMKIPSLAVPYFQATLETWYLQKKEFLSNTQFKLKMIEEDLIIFIPTFLQEDWYTYEKERRLEKFLRNCQTSFYDCKYVDK